MKERVRMRDWVLRPAYCGSNTWYYIDCACVRQSTSQRYVHPTTSELHPQQTIYQLSSALHLLTTHFVPCPPGATTKKPTFGSSRGTPDSEAPRTPAHHASPCCACRALCTSRGLLLLCRWPAEHCIRHRIDRSMGLLRQIDLKNRVAGENRTSFG